MRGQSRELLDLGLELADEVAVIDQVIFEVVDGVTDACAQPIEEIEQANPHLDAITGISILIEQRICGIQ
jgi:hypothetical protein